jgi:proteasome lid subunit RPN8/RPN11
VDVEPRDCFDVSALDPLLALVPLQSAADPGCTGCHPDSPGFRRRLRARMHSIPRHALDDIRRHSAEAYPDECCGVIVREADFGARVFRVRNIQDEMHAKDPAQYPRTARTAYAGHPQDLRLALDAADAPGCALLAFYHSHPDHDSYFSAEDVAQATPFGEPSYPDALQLVVSVYDREIRVIKAFAWSPPEETFVETPFEETAG